MHYLIITETILRSREDFFQEIHQQLNLRGKIFAMTLSSFTFLALYGIVMGASHSPQQALSSLVKLPILFLATLAITTPSLHIFYILFGARQSFAQTIALLLTAISTTALLLLGFAPITFFFIITSDHYHFFKLLNVVFFAFAGFLGVSFLQQGIRAVTEEGAPHGALRRRGIFAVWVALYGFVGVQMAWTLSPFMGIPEYPFLLIHDKGGNFFIDVFISILKLLGYV